MDKASSNNSRKRPRNDNSNSGSNNAGRGRGKSRGSGKNRRHHQSGRGGGRGVNHRMKNNDGNVARGNRKSPRFNNDNNGAVTVKSLDDAVTSKILPWPNPHTHYIPLHEEERLLPALLHWGKSERGMMKDQPSFRLQKIQKLLNGSPHHNKNSSNSHSADASSSSLPCKMTLIQALSLRRTHLKHLQPRLTMPQLKLGFDKDIRISAEVFERAVGNYLNRFNVLKSFWTEDQQKEHFREFIGGRMPPTPDFMVREGHCVQLDFGGNGDSRGASAKKAAKSQEATRTTTIAIHWLEAKMFYGASTIPPNTPNAVGAILPKMKEYVSLYGPGAIVFMYGCGDVLARQLSDIGVIALDGRGLDLRRVEKSQRKWCADERGNILF